ncbi:MAG: MarC family protein [Chrysiogenetes bacterium]|nr:MarC family protein [Chrysiogenetes bacterium]
MHDSFSQSVLFLLVLINPFLVSVYLIDLIRGLELPVFTRILSRAMIISTIAYIAFAWGGDRIFQDVFQVRFAAFQTFGGVVFLLIAVRSMLVGGQVMIELRGDPEHLAGAIAMPFMIGPATVSACVLIGAQSPLWKASLGIVTAVLATTVVLLGLKVVFDRVRERNYRLIERYMDIVGRVSAILLGTIAVEMIFRGLDSWLGR